jgi:putative hemolysin
MEGLVTMQDLLVEIVGEVEVSEPEFTTRDDGSLLIDGLILIDDFKELFLLESVPGENDTFTTLGGFVMAQTGNIPRSGDSFDWGRLHFEVIDMDGNRVDKVLVTEKPPEVEAAVGEAPASDAETSDPANGDSSPGEGAT